MSGEMYAVFCFHRCSERIACSGPCTETWDFEFIRLRLSADIYSGPGCYDGRTINHSAFLLHFVLYNKYGEDGGIFGYFGVIIYVGFYGSKFGSFYYYFIINDDCVPVVAIRGKILPPAFPFVPPPLQHPSHYCNPLFRSFPFIGGPYQRPAGSSLGSRAASINPLSPEVFGVGQGGGLSSDLATVSKKSESSNRTSIAISKSSSSSSGAGGGGEKLACIGRQLEEAAKRIGMALHDDDAKDEKPKVYKSDGPSDNSTPASRTSLRPAAASDELGQEKKDVGLEADDLQPCPSTSGSGSTAAAAGTSSNDAIPKHPPSDASTSAGICGQTTINGASPNGQSSSGVSTATSANANAETLRSTAFTRTIPNRISGLDALVNGLSASANYYAGMQPGLAYLATAGPSSGGSASAHGVIHPMASYPHNFPALYQAAATAHLMGNRFPGSPNAGSSPFTFQQGANPFAGFSPCYPTAPDGGQTAPSQAAAGQATFPFPLCTDPKTTGIRSPFAFFPAGQCSPSFGPPLLVQPSAIEQIYAAAQRYSSPIFPFMMTAAAASAPVPGSPGTLSPIVNSSPIAGGTLSLVTPTALAPPSLMPAYSAAPYVANSVRFPPSTASTATNALAAISQIPVPVAATSVKGSVTNTSVSSRGSSSHNGSTLNATSSNARSSSRNRTNADQKHHHHDENGNATVSTKGRHSSSKAASQEKASKDTTRVKKPMNAFMLYMKEMRPQMMQEVGLKERQSAEINKILGGRWHQLTRDQQQKYYDMAREERALHMQKYPNWSARDNYALHRKKKRKRDKAHENLEMKKCRARFGLDQQGKWCKHCRRKKKCLWFREGAGASSAASSGAHGNSGSDSAEQSPPCAQVTSTTNGPDMATTSAIVLAAETDVNSPHSLVTSTIPMAGGSKTDSGTNKKKASSSYNATLKSGSKLASTKSPSRKKSRRTNSLLDDHSSSASEDDEGSSSEIEFDEEEIDEEAEAAAAARAAVEGADFDDEMADFASPQSAIDHKDIPPSR